MNGFIFGEYVHGIRNRNRIEQLPDSPDCYGQSITGVYTSVYRYDNQIIEHQNRTGSISGFTGPCRATGLHFDFDSPHNDLAQQNVIQFIEDTISERSFNLTIDNYEVYYSANKGFHVFIRSKEIDNLPPSEKVPEQIKRLCISLAGKYSTFDKTVYDKTRLFRVTNSRHPKSNLFKIPIFPAELYTCTMQDIRKLAQKQRRLSDTETIHNFMRRCGHATS